MISCLTSLVSSMQSKAANSTRFAYSPWREKIKHYKHHMIKLYESLWILCFKSQKNLESIERILPWQICLCRSSWFWWWLSCPVTSTTWWMISWNSTGIKLLYMTDRHGCMNAFDHSASPWASRATGSAWPPVPHRVCVPCTQLIPWWTQSSPKWW